MEDDAAPVDDEVPEGLDADADASADGEEAGDGEQGEDPAAAAPKPKAVDLSSFKGRQSEAIVNAAAAGNVALVARFLDPGETVKSLPIDVNSVDSARLTPLMWAVRNRHAGVLAFLLRSAPDLDLDRRDRSGRTALHWCVWERCYKFMRMLLRRGAGTSPRDHIGRTPLCCAVDAGDTTALRILLDARADIDAADCVGRTPLFHAIVGCTTSEQRTKAVLEELLARGADVNLADREGQTPLIWCAQRNYPALLRQLAATGRCDPEIEDNSRRTALDHAAGIGEGNGGGPFCTTLLADAELGRARLAERHEAFHSKAMAIAAAPRSRSARGAARLVKDRAMNDVLPRVRSKIQAAAYVAGGQDWDKLFRFYDKSGDGELQIDELTNAIRRDLKLAPKDVSKDEIEIVFNFLDKDGGGSVDMDELLNFIDPEKYPLESTHVSFAGAGALKVAASRWHTKAAAHLQADAVADFRVDRTIGSMSWYQAPKKKLGVVKAHLSAGDMKKKASPSAKLAPLASSQSAPAIVGFEGFAGFVGFESLEFDDMSVGSLPSVSSSMVGGRISLGSMG